MSALNVTNFSELLVWSFCLQFLMSFLWFWLCICSTLFFPCSLVMDYQGSLIFLVAMIKRISQIIKLLQYLSNKIVFLQKAWCFNWCFIRICALKMILLHSVLHIFYGCLEKYRRLQPKKACYIPKQWTKHTQ